MSDQHVLLIGGGHAHVAVLADWIERGRPARASLLTPHPTLRYSGMVPGWIAGQYDRDEGLVDLAGLAERAGVELVLDRCARIDPVARTVLCESGQKVAFDTASIDTGGVGRAQAVLGEDPRVLDVRPIDRFVQTLSGRDEARDIVIVGGGAGGVELAFALRNRKTVGREAPVAMITGREGLLPGFAPGVITRVEHTLSRQGIGIIEADAVMQDGVLQTSDSRFDPDLIIAALGSAAPDWPSASGLAVDEQGFIAVDRFQRSTSHPHIFASGDVAARTDRDVPHSGVHAVHTGPVLAANLRAAIDGETPRESYIPRKASLYLLSTGDGGAILSYGRWSAKGEWAGRLKRWIDKRWINKYAELARRA